MKKRVSNISNRYSIKMNYYETKQKMISIKVHDKYHNRSGKKKAAEYYKKNRGVITEKRK